MSVIVSRSSRTWAATQRRLLAVIAFAVAVAATVVIVLMTSGSSPSSSLQAPDQGQTGTRNQAPAGTQNPVQPDTQKSCLQYMGVRPC